VIGIWPNYDISCCCLCMIGVCGEYSAILRPYTPPCSTARGFDYGTALTFVCPGEEDRLALVEERLRGRGGVCGCLGGWVGGWVGE